MEQGNQPNPHIAQWASPLLLLGRSHLYRFIQNSLKYLIIFKNICTKLSRPELGKGVKVPSKVKDKQLMEVMKEYCKKVTTETTGKNSTKSRPGQASRWSSRSVEWGSNGSEIVIFEWPTLDTENVLLFIVSILVSHCWFINVSLHFRFFR